MERINNLLFHVFVLLVLLFGVLTNLSCIPEPNAVTLE